VVDVEERVVVEGLERLLTDVYEFFMVGDLEAAAERVSVLFSPPYVEMWRLRARRSITKVRRKLELRFGRRMSRWSLMKRGVQLIGINIAYSILKRLGFPPPVWDDVALVVGGAAVKMFDNLARGWRRSVYAMAVMYATQLEEGFGVPYAVALKLVALAAAVAFYIAANPSPVEDLVGVLE